MLRERLGLTAAKPGCERGECGACTVLIDDRPRLDRLKGQKVVVGVGQREPNPQDLSITPFAAQFCELEVCTLTGEVRLPRLLGTNESGRVINRLTWDGQLVGGVTMGVGFAMTEARVLDTPINPVTLVARLHERPVSTRAEES